MKRLVILGGGESGAGAAVLGKAQGFEVFVSDYGTIAENYQKELKGHKINFEQQQHTESDILNADLVVKSPGIPKEAPIVQKLIAADVAIISEIEFAARYTDAKIIAITGSNGKTTTTLLMHHMLHKAGLNVGMAGNVGDSFARMVATEKYDYYVLEVSSFQLDDIEQFRPWISVLTNITPDHLDRYEYDFRKYADAKFRIAENQTEEDHFIYNLDDPVTIELLKDKKIKAQNYGFAYEKQDEAVAWVKHNAIQLEMNLENSAFSIESMTLQGRHNMYNTMAAAVVGNILELRKEKVRESFSDFRNAEHRLEKVAMVRGVEFINDSKATNVNSTWYALESVNKPIVWVAGGVDKGNDYSILAPMVEKKVRCIIALGANVLKIHKAFSQKVDMIVNINSMEEAVKLSYHLADKGDAVLLSPACASFDMFDD
ncbi:MAG TPA: UDP-N-acetylmuramoyl-L-alanine--D-glutamate ligase, partial [Bacteroidetes bacterium]|nr:UDP-N-acetylmuramoyl-L-alanine--D-glutamate ligase [Bacteroidota bacterium]